MHSSVFSRSAAIVLICTGIASFPGWIHIPVHAAEIYGVEMVGDRYIVRVFDTDHAESVREVAALPAGIGEQLRGLVQLDDRRIALLRTIANGGESPRNELAVLGTPGQLTGVQRRDVYGLEPFMTLTQIFVAWGARYYGLVGLDNDRPPYQLVTFFSGSTAISKLNSVELPAHARYANLTQCPDGTIYASTLAPQQDTRLVTLNPETAQIIELSQLRLNERTVPSDIFGLTCDPKGRLYALADPTRLGTASLFAVDATNGTLRWLGYFRAHKMALVKNP